MQCFQGKSVYKGIAMGPIVVLKKNDYQVKRTRIEDTEAEVKRVDEALKTSQEQLQKLYDKAVREVGEASAAIFEVHQMMLEDEDYLEAIQNMIRTEQVNAEYAVAVTGDNFAEMFASMDDDYMKARSADIKDISEEAAEANKRSHEAFFSTKKNVDQTVNVFVLYNIRLDINAYLTNDADGNCPEEGPEGSHLCYQERKATRTVETQKLEIRPKKIISCSLILLLFKP